MFGLMLAAIFFLCGAEVYGMEGDREVIIQGFRSTGAPIYRQLVCCPRGVSVSKFRKNVAEKLHILADEDVHIYGSKAEIVSTNEEFIQRAEKEQHFYVIVRKKDHETILLTEEESKESD